MPRTGSPSGRAAGSAAAGAGPAAGRGAFRRVAEQATDGPALPDSFYGWGSLRPPPRQPHLFRDIVYNELAIAVSCGYLGDGSRPTLTTCELELLRTLGLIDTVRCVCHMF